MSSRFVLVQGSCVILPLACFAITIFRTPVCFGRRGVRHQGSWGGQPPTPRHDKRQIFWIDGGYLKIWKDKPVNRNYFPCLATKQSTDEMIRAMHWSATLRADSMGLRNYPSSKSHIPPQMGRNHIPIFSEWKAESAWPGPKWDPDEPKYPDETGHSRGQGKIPQIATKFPQNAR